MTTVRLFFVFLSAALVSSCQTGVTSVSSRKVGFDKASDNLVGYGRPIHGVQKRPEIYVKQEDIKIEPVEKENTTGSLFDLSDQRNYLFTNRKPTMVGSYIDIKIASNRIDDLNKSQQKNSKSEGDDKSNQKDEKKDAPDKAIQEILNAIPDLIPQDGKAALINQFKMQVIHQYKNGDLLLATKRTSQREDQANEINIAAKISNDKVVAEDGYTTNDLFDIHWAESQNGEIIERFSAGWEDEYTLRLSGFNEAKSRIAFDLENKRKQLMEVRDKLTNEAKSMGDERKKIAKEREELFEQRRKEAQKLEEMAKKLDEQKKQIEDQQKKIEDLKPPEEKPGDEKDAAKGK